MAALVASFGVYAWTVAPSVTLLDSGEFLTAGQHFGVPHPTGYPIWTMLAWLISRLPFGNAAWEINLLSALLGAMAVGLSAALSRSCLRWIFPGPCAAIPGLASVSAISAAMLLTFSFSMWSQAVITEVYTLHALLIGGFLVSMYAWIRRPLNDRFLLLSFFLLTLAFCDHQLTLAFVPLPFLVVLVVRPRIFWDVLMAACVTAGLFYLLFASVSNDPLVMKAAIRFGYGIVGVLGCYFFFRKRAGLRILLSVPVVVALGLLPYAYLPIASSTNPPMNWSYARELSGLFNSFNRSQYNGPLTEQTLRVVGKLTGVPMKKDLKPPAIKDRFAPKEPSQWEVLRDWAVFFARQIARSFTPFGIVAYLVSLLACWGSRDRQRWVWIIFLQVAFVLAALLEPVLDKTGADLSAWWQQMPYHTYTNLVFSLLCAIGFFRSFTWICQSAYLRKPRLASLLQHSFYALLFLPILTFRANYAECNQRDHWFGWQYGHDILKDLPNGSVMVGGSDPGRFVPTYMIFGESSQPARFKRDPNFDRRDLFILTQNALGEPHYMKYLRDQYTDARKPVRTSFERWLGRGTQYPKESLILPTEEESKVAIQSAMLPDPQTGRPIEGNLGILPFSALLHWIWEKNRDWHEFYIEESFPITWTYDYAIPCGLVYKLNSTKLDAIPADAVRQDFSFWHNYKNRLLSDPQFADDLDARRSFCRLRFTIGNIYRHWKMNREAELAYKEALELFPGDGGVVHALMLTQWDRGEFQECLRACKNALREDPSNPGLHIVQQLAEKMSAIQERIEILKKRVERNPRDKNALKSLIMLIAGTSDLRQANEYLIAGLKAFSNSPDFLRFAAAYYELNGQPLYALAPALQLVRIEPGNPANQFILAHSWYSHNKLPEVYKALKLAVDAGGVPIQEMIRTDDYFVPLRNEEEFRRLAPSL